MNKLIIVLAVLLGYNCIVGLTAMPFKTGEMSDAERLIKSLDPSDLAYFITYHLTKEAEKQGRNDIEVVQVFEKITTIKLKDYSMIAVPVNFGRNLLNWSEEVMVKRKHDMARKDYLSDLKVCFPSGCVDPNDIGSNCCPF